MTTATARFLGLSLSASLACTLGAQDLAEAFRILPQATKQVQIYGNLGRIRQQVQRLQHRLVAGKAQQPMLPELTALGIKTEDLNGGLVVVAGLPSGPEQPDEIFLVIPRNFQHWTKALGAVRAGDGWKLTRAGGVTYLAQQGRFALLSRNPELLKTVQAADTHLEPELASLEPWIASHDLVLLAPAQTLAAAFQAMNQSPAPDPASKAMLGLLKPILTQASGSIRQGALAVDFQEDGSVRAVARAFFAPDSALALKGGRAQAPAQHPMAGHGLEGLVLGGGGPVPKSLATLSAKLLSGLTPPADAGQDPALSEAMLKQQLALGQAIQAVSFSLATPPHPGDPILAGMTARTQVQDPAEYLKLTAATVETNRAAMEALGFHAEVQKDVLPGVPSLTVTQVLDLSKGKPGLAPVVQMKMIFTLLFGSPDHITTSSARLDEHTVLTVFGGAKELKAALAAQRPDFGQNPGVAQVDALLPAGAPWRGYVSLQGVRDLVEMVMAGLGTGSERKSLPVLPAVAPLGLALKLDATGIELGAAATGASLDALGTLVTGIQGLFPSRPAMAAQPAAKGKLKGKKTKAK